MARPVLAGIAALLLGLAGCASLEGLSGGKDSGSDQAAPVDAGADAPCPGSEGPTPVRVGAFCIDSTEVTQAHYQRFLEADASTTSQPPFCSWNTSYAPGADAGCTADYDAAGSPDNPVGCVDWCDAYAYCAWAGKRLCGDIGGGGSPYASAMDPAHSQWFFACSRDGARIYPYGNVCAPVCRGSDTVPDGGPAIVPVESMPSCQGGFDGIYDMSGNVHEWEDSCDGTSGPQDYCHERGGSAEDQTNCQMRCDLGGVLLRSQVWGDVGFRCCSP